MLLCRTTSTSTSTTLTTAAAAAAALTSAFLSRARFSSSSSSLSSSSSSPPTPSPPQKKSTAKKTDKQPLHLSGAARRSLSLYRAALRAAALQPSDEGREALAKMARGAMEKSRKVDSQTAEHLQRRGKRQLELVRSGAAVLGTVRVE